MTHNKFLLVAFLALMLILVVKGYIYTYLLADFQVRTYFSCDPVEFRCFTVDDEEYYTYGTLPAKLYRECSQDDSCDRVCAETDQCEMEYCTEDMESEEEWCSEEFYFREEGVEEASDADEPGDADL